MRVDARKGNGGARKGAGRKPNTVPTKAGEVRLTVEQRVRIPVAHNDVIEQRGKDWLRAVIAKAVAEPQ